MFNLNNFFCVKSLHIRSFIANLLSSVCVCVHDIYRLADHGSGLQVEIKPIETNNFVPDSLNASICKPSGKGNVGLTSTFLRDWDVVVAR